MIFGTLLFAGTFIPPVKNVTAFSCTDVHAIFARGSGQGMNNGEANRFFTQLQGRINTNIVSYSTYELGTSVYDGHRYTAVDVGNPFTGVAIGAALTAGNRYSYGASVKDGVAELAVHINERLEQCPNTKFVLGGYSQGAQVMGDYLRAISYVDEDHLTYGEQRLRSSITFVALFGDPKLYLPEGEGLYPLACRGVGYSSWRRTIGNCHTDGGSLTARNPYLPDWAKYKTGLWCAASDFVCGSSKIPTVLSGHESYKNNDGPIDEAVREAAANLAIALDTYKSQAVNATYFKHGSEAYGLDVAFVLSYNVSTPARLQASKEAIIAAAEKVVSQGGRVALTVYEQSYSGGGVISYPPQIGGFPSGFRNYTSNIRQVLSTLPARPYTGNGGMMTALSGTLQSLDWKYGAAKAIVVITENGTTGYPHDTWNRQYVPRKARQIDPVNIYPVVSSDHEENVRFLADETGGRVVSYDNQSSSVEDVINEAMEEVSSELIERPTVIFKNEYYEARPGDEIIFDVSDSFVVDSEIVSYDWDLNGDGQWDQTTVDPQVRHTYHTDTSVMVHARARSAKGMTGSMTTNVNVTDYVMEVEDGPDTVEIHEDEDDASRALLEWNHNDDGQVDSWLIYLNDEPSVRLPKDQRSLNVTDMDRTIDNDFYVRALLYDGSLTKGKGVKLSNVTPPEVPAPSPPLPDDDRPEGGELPDDGEPAPYVKPDTSRPMQQVVPRKPVVPSWLRSHTPSWTVSPKPVIDHPSSSPIHSEGNSQSQDRGSNTVVKEGGGFGVGALSIVVTALACLGIAYLLLRKKP